MKFKIMSFVLGPVMTNAYLLYDQQQNRGLIIDPGMHPSPLLKLIRDKKINIAAILLTHAHFDHIGGLEEVRSFCNAPVYIHHREADWLTDSQRNGSAFWPEIPEVRCAPAEHLLKGDETLTFFDCQIKVCHTPGHSPGSISFFINNSVFSGDLIFMDSIGRTDLPGGDYAVLMNSVQKHFIKLPKSTLIYPGHGPQTTTDREFSQNPFLKKLVKK